MHSELVSVIIPAYNAEKYILECINSVLLQTYKNLEVIVVNDGSTDQTTNLLNKLIDKRLVILNQENRGCSHAKNTGLKRAKGAFIQYLDADDVLSEDKIEIQVKTLRNSENSIAVCKTLIIEEKINHIISEVDTELIKKEGTGIEFFLRLMGSEGVNGMVQPNAYLITKELAAKIGEWNEEISPSPDEDGEYFARALCCADRVIFTKGVNYYRKIEHTNSLSQNISKERILNLLKTVDLKFQHIFKIEKSQRTLRLYQLNISQLVYQYGNTESELVICSKQLLKNNGIKKFKVNEPLKFSLISKVFGFEISLFIKKCFTNL
jgi:glycosyltransferase involved in cell wall biosynthesis